MQTLETPLILRPWTVAEYYRMAEAGILSPDERVELLEGQIIRKMSPQGTAHATAIRRGKKVLESRLAESGLAEEVLLQIQLPIRLSDRSEPEPDFALVMGDELRYCDRHPTPADIYLVIEIADTTLKIDCEIKASSYASSGIADYWVIDVNRRQLHLFRDPSANGYQSQSILSANATLSPLAFPDLRIAIADMLPPAKG